MFHGQHKKEIDLLQLNTQQMTRTVLWLLLIITGMNLQAQTNNQKEALKKTIDTFFEALHTGNADLMKTVLHDELHVQTTRDNKEGKNLLFTESKEKLLQSVASKKPEDKYYEKLLSYDIKIDGNLASVWTPYEFYYNDNFSHCGANSFQLFDDNGTWKIIYLVDMRRRQGCKPSEVKK